jgi:hypothetical protein
VNPRWADDAGTAETALAGECAAADADGVAMGMPDDAAASDAHTIPLSDRPRAASISGSNPEHPVHQTVTRATRVRTRRTAVDGG